MDSGLLIGWIFEVMMASLALSVVAHAVFGRVRVWTALAAGLLPPIVRTAMDLGLPPYPSDSLLLGAYLAALGSIAGVICSSVGAWVAVGIRRFVVEFAATLRD